MVMLSELNVENLLLIERAQLRLSDGLNVLTGETGAGKTVLAHALDLLLGGRAGRTGAPSTIVRPGASEAYVEGVFELSDALREELGERLPRQRSGDRPGAAHRCGWPAHARVSERTHRDRRRAVRPRRPARLLLRSARAPQADPRERPTADPRRPVRPRSARAPAHVCRRPPPERAPAGRARGAA